MLPAKGHCEADLATHLTQPHYQGRRSSFETHHLASGLHYPNPGAGRGGVALAATVNCMAGADCAGTPNPDTINGSAEADNRFGRAGADTVKSNEGGDYLQGDRGADDLGDGDGRDSLWGGSLLEMGPLDGSSDVVHGGVERDYIYSGFAQGGVDHVFGDRGNDTVEAEKAYG
jgi:hypothetical protein